MLDKIKMIDKQNFQYPFKPQIYKSKNSSRSPERNLVNVVTDVS